MCLGAPLVLVLLSVPSPAPSAWAAERWFVPGLYGGGVAVEEKPTLDNRTWLTAGGKREKKGTEQKLSKMSGIAQERLREERKQWRKEHPVLQTHNTGPS